MKITKRQLRRIIKEAMTDHWDARDKIALSGMKLDDEHADLYLDLGADGDFPTLNDGDSYKQWEVPHFTSASDFLDEVLTQLPGSTPDTIVVGEEMDLPDLPLSQVWDAVMDAGRRR